jgi:hypothetical protein
MANDFRALHHDLALRCSSLRVKVFVAQFNITFGYGCKQYLEPVGKLVCNLVIHVHRLGRF